MAWGVGEQLQGSKYTIERELGRGRFGITYLAKDENGDRLVIKTLNDDLLNSTRTGQTENDVFARSRKTGSVSTSPY